MRYISHCNIKLIACTIKKEWITEIGKERTNGDGSGIVFIVKKAIFPNFKEDVENEPCVDQKNCLE